MSYISVLKSLRLSLLNMNKYEIDEAQDFERLKIVNNSFRNKKTAN